MTDSKSDDLETHPGLDRWVTATEGLTLEDQKSRPQLTNTTSSISIPRLGAILTGKQEHCMLIGAARNDRH